MKISRSHYCHGQYTAFTNSFFSTITLGCIRSPKREYLGDNWAAVQLPPLLRNQQYQNNERSSKHWPQLGNITPELLINHQLLNEQSSQPLCQLACTNTYNNTTYQNYSSKSNAASVGCFCELTWRTWSGGLNVSHSSHQIIPHQHYQRHHPASMLHPHYSHTELTHNSVKIELNCLASELVIKL